MAITCWAPGCNHSSLRETCSFFRFPIDKKEYKRWITLIRRGGDSKPGTGARICSCHFRDGKKENGPEIFAHNKEKFFNKHYLSPEKRKARKRVILLDTESEPSTSAIESENSPPPSEQHLPSMPGTSKDVPILEVESPSSSNDPIASTLQTSRTMPSTAMYEAEIYLAKLEAERKVEIIKTLKFCMTYEQICESDKLILEYTGLPRQHISSSVQIDR
ncbi:uncharacterized protein LOC108912482 [Anoplophora glabripennis]|uniref:uncharacterized protein LOC108912482 n=1 Tax=Anoplophora glabripennis TaxID=217634 RepID=UPI000C758165|nr:uncharacterized protein LOC108912482 [Anoplophora glabripennis]